LCPAGIVPAVETPSDAISVARAIVARAMTTLSDA
jgi:hypothetical protein